MKITLCGSIAFYQEMEQVKDWLEAAGHQVKLPPTQIKNDQGEMIPVLEYYRLRKAAGVNDSWIWDRKAEAIRNHFNKIEWADAILVLNYDKNGITNYIGTNTIMEMGLAFHFKKPIYLLNPIPEVSGKEEILGMKPMVLNGRLNLIQLTKLGT